MRLGLRNLDFEGLGDFVEAFAAAKWGHGLRNGTRVPRGCLAATKIFAGGSYGAAKWFRSRGSIFQPTLDFAADGHFRRGLFWAAKFRRPLNFLGSELLLAP